MNFRENVKSSCKTAFQKLQRTIKALFNDF